MKKVALISCILFLTFSSFVYAVEPQTIPGNETDVSNKSNETDVSNPKQVIPIHLNNPLKTGSSLEQLFKSIIEDVLMPIGGIIAVLAFIWTGFKYVMARGDESAIKEAHRAFLYTAIGTAVLLGSWVLIKVISATIDQLKS